MKISKLSIVLLISLLWIFITNYKFFPINNIGSLLTYKTGLLGIKKTNKIYPKLNKGKELVIKIDTLGIPYIYASKDSNLAYGLGYMHAKDRYFQMELMSKMVKGELSSMLGGRVIQSDKFWKPYEFHRKAKEILEEYKANSDELYAYLVNYSDGINAFLEENKVNDPLYTIFNLKPQNWKPEYCILTAWYMSWNLAYFDYHAERQELLDKLPQKLLNKLYPQKFEALKTILPSVITTQTPIDSSVIENITLNNRKVILSKFNTDIGSNNWAINSKKTNKASSLIVNDPHLFLTLPGAFYETSLIGNTIKVYGYSIPGVPLVVSGHNTNISWGITNGEWDLMDSYLLKTKKDSLYLFQGNWIPFQEKEYSINIRGKGEKKFKVKRTVHGIVNKEDSTYYAQKWHPSEKNYSMKALFNIMKTDSYNGFKNALKEYDYPPQNFIYADVNDTIGIVCAGKLPKRPQGFNGGLLDGTKKPLKSEFIATQWETSNPEQNYLFSANQLPAQNKHYFGAHWHKDDYRVNRIDKLLKEKDDWSVPAIKSMQLDEVDLSFFHLKKVFKNNSITKKYNNLTELFSNWDGNMKNNSEKAFIYETLRKNVEEEAKRFANEELKVQQVPSMKSFLNYLNSEVSSSKLYSTKEIIINNILKKTDSILSIENQLVKREYSQISTINIYNISFLPGFGNKIVNAGGNKNTINLNASVHPVFRSIYEMEKGNIKGYTIMAGGQSGKINSNNYSDQIDYWKKGRYKKTQFAENPEDLKNIINTINFK
ncbi:penicillin acylase family protein [Tenacibaculum sp. 190524A02b]|uniref:penicillin acylase family protein n=1 Tax=Tenacibaculum vairaonense TaxID=3137860 RepID=UPI0031FAB928